MVRDFHTFRINVAIDLAADLEPGVGCGAADQLNDDLVTDQRLAAPVLRDIGEQPVLDAVPLCALPRCTDVVGANPTRQLSLQPEAPRKHPERIRR